MWTESTWLTTTLRPAGVLDRDAIERLGASIAMLSTTCDLVVLDLSASAVSDADRLGRLLREPAARLSREGGCLMLRGVPDDLTDALSAAPLAAVS